MIFLKKSIYSTQYLDTTAMLENSTNHYNKSYNNTKILNDPQIKSLNYENLLLNYVTYVNILRTNDTPWENNCLFKFGRFCFM